MKKQKGQIQIVFLLLIVIGIILFTTVFNSDGDDKKTSPKSFLKDKTETTSPTTPSQKQDSEPPVISSIPDTDPPERLNAEPDTDLPATTRKTSLTLETDEKAVCKYSDTSGMSYDTMKVFSQTDSTTHSTEVTGFSEGEEYEYYIKCADQDGNKNTNDLKISFEVKEPEDITPPVRSHPYPAGDVLRYDTTEVTISISTDEDAYCRYSTQQGISYKDMPERLTRDKSKKYHTATVDEYDYYYACTDEDEDDDCLEKVTKDFEQGTNYSFFVRCEDSKDNVNTGDVMISFSIKE